MRRYNQVPLKQESTEVSFKIVPVLRFDTKIFKGTPYLITILSVGLSVRQDPFSQEQLELLS